MALETMVIFLILFIIIYFSGLIYLASKDATKREERIDTIIYQKEYNIIGKAVPYYQDLDESNRHVVRLSEFEGKEFNLIMVEDFFVAQDSITKESYILVYG